MKWYDTHMNSSEAKWNQLSPHPLPPILLSNFSWPYRYTYIYIYYSMLLYQWGGIQADLFGGSGGGVKELMYYVILCYIVLLILSYSVIYYHISQLNETLSTDTTTYHRHKNLDMPRWFVFMSFAYKPWPSFWTSLNRIYQLIYVLMWLNINSICACVFIYVCTLYMCVLFGVFD